MIVDDKQLESIVYLTPPRHGRGIWKVYVGELLVFTTYHMGEAESKVKQLRDAMVIALKRQIVTLAGNFCERCQRKEVPRKKKTKFGLRVYHYDHSMGWQPCDADFMWLALIRDTLERQGSNNGVDERV